MVHDLRCVASLDTVAGHRNTGPLIADRLFNSVGYACIMDGRQPDVETLVRSTGYLEQVLERQGRSVRRGFEIMMRGTPPRSLGYSTRRFAHGCGTGAMRDVDFRETRLEEVPSRVF